LSAHAQVTRWRLGLLLGWPTIATLALTVVPLALLLRISVAPTDLAAPWGEGFSWAAYRSLVDSDAMRSLLQSLQIALVVATISLVLGYPLTWLITRMSRRPQVAWLIFLLTTLTLSDVLIAFSWQVMLSKRVGLSKLLVAAGLMTQPDSLAPSVGAVMACLTYLVIPFTVLTLYPALSDLEPALIEAARTMGASPWRAFSSLVLPATRTPIVMSFVLAMVLTLGSYVPPIALGRPEHWPMSVLIGNAALAGHDVPRAAAMSVLLLAVTVLLVMAATRAQRRKMPA
jgi:putative spermidine/putrescine transport system permease protein